jgi:hypothetical protein
VKKTYPTSSRKKNKKGHQKGIRRYYFAGTRVNSITKKKHWEMKRTPDFSSSNGGVTKKETKTVRMDTVMMVKMRLEVLANADAPTMQTTRQKSRSTEP